MMPFTDISGLAGVVFAIVVLTLRLPIAARLPAKKQVWLAGAILCVVSIPFGGLSVTEFARGLTGDLSMTTLLLLSLAGYGNRGSLALSGQGEEISWGLQGNKNTLFALIVIAALALYPFALGIGMFDPYRLGFGNLWFMAGLSVVAMAAWVRRDSMVVLSLSLAVLAWGVGWYESSNLWDYLLDPWVAIYALSALIKRGLSRVAKQYGF